MPPSRPCVRPSQVLDVLNAMFVHIFQGLQTRFKHELETVASQYPFEPFQFLQENPRIEFAEGVRLLREAGYDMDDLEVRGWCDVDDLEVRGWCDVDDRPRKSGSGKSTKRAPMEGVWTVLLVEITAIGSVAG